MGSLEPPEPTLDPPLNWQGYQCPVDTFLVYFDERITISFIIYLQKLPIDTTYFPTQKYKILYHPTSVF